ncbi:hypothetical protein [Marinagarivorans algicola]|uniref:hypothetical protein n=1 Tax=Marinagarivorans algicola TaxID=1513270 RepID=UPI0006B9BFAE|nr:hypothetical protein [Marinagarivorans algicola]
MNVIITESHYTRPTILHARPAITIEGEHIRTPSPKPNTPHSGTTVQAHTASPQAHPPIRTIEAKPVKDDAQLLDPSRIYTPDLAGPAFTKNTYPLARSVIKLGSTIDTFV